MVVQVRSEQNGTVLVIGSSTAACEDSYKVHYGTDHPYALHEQPVADLIVCGHKPTIEDLRIGERHNGNAREVYDDVIDPPPSGDSTLAERLKAAADSMRTDPPPPGETGEELAGAAASAAISKAVEEKLSESQVTEAMAHATHAPPISAPSETTEAAPV